MKLLFIIYTTIFINNLAIAAISTSTPELAPNKVESAPLIKYGNTNSPVHITVYMSPSCKDAIIAYKEIIIKHIKSEYVATGKASLTILPYYLSDREMDRQIILNCSTSGFAASFEWYFQNMSHRQKLDQVIEAGNKAGLGLSAATSCKNQIEILKALLNIRESAIKKWHLKEIPYFIVNGVGLDNPNWEKLKILIDTAHTKATSH